MRPLEQFDPEGFDRSIAINLKGPYFLIQALLSVFANPASIVLNGSVNAHIGMPNTSVYSASKAALLSLVAQRWVMYATAAETSHSRLVLRFHRDYYTRWKDGLPAESGR